MYLKWGLQSMVQIFQVTFEWQKLQNRRGVGFPSRSLNRLSTRELNTVCLKFLKFAHFSLVVLARRQPSFVLRIKIALNFMHLRSKSFKINNFEVRQVKSCREYFRIFKRFYAVLTKIVILKPCGVRLPCA